MVLPSTLMIILPVLVLVALELTLTISGSPYEISSAWMEIHIERKNIANVVSFSAASWKSSPS